MSGQGFKFGKFAGGGAAATAAQAGPMAGGFKRSTSVAAAAPAQVQTPARSEWDGITPRQNRANIAMAGDYVFRVVSDEMLERSDYWQSNFEVVWAADGSGHKQGDRVSFLQGLGGKQGDVGKPIVFSYVLAAAGFSQSDSDVAAFRENLGSDFINACRDGRKDTPLAGRLVHVVVSRGGARVDDKGNAIIGQDGQPDYWRNWDWDPIGEDDQDQRKQTEWLT